MKRALLTGLVLVSVGLGGFLMSELSAEARASRLMGAMASEIHRLESELGRVRARVDELEPRSRAAYRGAVVTDEMLRRNLAEDLRTARSAR